MPKTDCTRSSQAVQEKIHHLSLHHFTPNLHTIKIEKGHHNLFTLLPTPPALDMVPLDKNTEARANPSTVCMYTGKQNWPAP